MLYHVNDAGEAGVCKAKNGKCPFASEDEHFTSLEAARASYEESQATFSAKRPKKTFAEHFPLWGSRLPKEVERAILKKLDNDLQAIDDVESGKVETRYADVTQFLTPPIDAIRSRSTSFVDEDDAENLDDEYGIKASSEDGVLISIYSRQGGGNDECYCNEDSEDYDSVIGHEPGCLKYSNELMEAHPQYVGRVEGEWDNTYITHYFDGGFTAEDRAKWADQARKLYAAQRLKTTIEKIRSGAVTPWSVLAEPGAPKTGQYGGLQALQAIQQKVVDSEKYVNTGEAVIKRMAAKEPLTPEEAGTADQLASYGYNQRPNYAKDYQEMLDKKAKVETHRKMVKDAESLPDGDLKDYLLKDRGSFTYTTKEKQGRRNVTVTKTGQRGSLLGSELKSAESSAESSERYFNGSLLTKRFNENLDKSKETLKNHQRTVERMEAARKEAWEAGWPGLKRDLPEIASTF